MKPLLCTLVAVLSLSAFGAELTPEEWGKQELASIEQGTKQYAKAFEDPSFLEALQDARDAAHARQDAILNSPDWPFKLIEKVHRRHYEHVVDSPAPVVQPTPEEAQYQAEWTAQEEKHLNHAKELYRIALSDPSFVEALSNARDAAEEQKDEIFQSPDWSLKLLDRVHRARYGKPVEPLVKLAPAYATAPKEEATKTQPLPEVELVTRTQVLAYWRAGVKSKDPAVSAFFGPGMLSVEKAWRIVEGIDRGDYYWDAAIYAAQLNQARWASVGRTDKVTEYAQRVQSLTQTRDQALANSQRIAAQQAADDAARAAELAQAKSAAAAQARLGAEMRAIRAMEQRDATRMRNDINELKRKARDAEAARAMRDQDAVFGRGAR
ncbi:hypothetical protein [Verrucomicrobium sp. BvORR106]|uniref:hypothetical protein n=1 Tax=Verrucomicrobium sp. BvORR106 TaxID=1403819 RepID=UPI00057073F5|nr:hypothetical protein [Verrucomicrobium sp. BvORR106]